jgi:hypothetical protein
MEVLELASMIGIHSSNVRSEVLLETMNDEGITPETRQEDARSAEIESRFFRTRDYWDASWGVVGIRDGSNALNGTGAQGQGTGAMRPRPSRHVPLSA